MSVPLQELVSPETLAALRQLTAYDDAPNWQGWETAPLSTGASRDNVHPGDNVQGVDQPGSVRRPAGPGDEVEPPPRTPVHSARVEADWALVQRAQAGDQGAFACLYAQNKGLVMGFAVRRMAHADAEEVVAETFVRAYQILDRFVRPGRFVSWLYAIAGNIIRNRLTSSRHRRERLAGLPEEYADVSNLWSEPDAESSALRRLDSQELVEAAKTLSQRERDVVTLRFLLGLTIRETCETLGISASACNRAQSEALASLRRIMRQPAAVEENPPEDLPPHPDPSGTPEATPVQPPDTPAAAGHSESQRPSHRPTMQTDNSTSSRPRVRVRLLSADPITRAGVDHQLRPHPDVHLLDDTDGTEAEVTLIVCDTVDQWTLDTMRTLRSRDTTPIVLVATHIHGPGMVAAAEHGLAGIIRRPQATPTRLVAALRAAAAGAGFVPPDLLGWLLRQLGIVQRDVLGPRGLTFCGLADREIEVLRLVADGYDTNEIATKLSCSERTVKNILQETTNRLHLRNRSHAVAYAIRNGLI